MGNARRLEDICQGLTLLVGQGEVMGSLTNTNNAQRINGLVEDIHEALMGYHVCTATYLFFTMSNIHARLHCNGI